MANKAIPRSLNELKSTVQTTIENTSDIDEVEKILGQKRPVIKPTEKLTKEERLSRIQAALEIGHEKYIRDRNDGKFDCNHFPADIQETIQLFSDLWQIKPPKQKEPGFADWIKGGRELMNACGEFGYELIKQIYDDWKKTMSYMVSRPGSLVNVARSMAGVIRQKTDTPILGEVNRDERYSWDSTLTEEENLQRIEQLTGEKISRM